MEFDGGSSGAHKGGHLGGRKAALASQPLSADQMERFGKNWTAEEEQTLICGYQTHGPDWEALQALLPGRVGVQSKWKRLIASGVRRKPLLCLQRSHARLPASRVTAHTSPPPPLPP